MILGSSCLLGVFVVLLPSPVQLWTNADQLDGLGALLGVLVVWAVLGWSLLVLLAVIVYRASRGLLARRWVLHLVPGQAGRVLLIAISAGIALSSTACSTPSAAPQVPFAVQTIDWPETADIPASVDWPSTAPDEATAPAEPAEKATTTESVAAPPSTTAVSETAELHTAHHTKPETPVDVPAPAVNGQPAHIVVAPGDSLWSITARHLATDDAALIDKAHRALYAANIQTIGAEADLILPGQVLALPDSFPAVARHGISTKE